MFIYTHETCSDPDVFLGFLNVLAGITNMAWIHYTTTGGGNENAVIMFGTMFLLNCAGIVAVFYRRRLLWSRGQLNSSHEDSDEEDMDLNSSGKNSTKLKPEKRIKQS